MAPFTYQPFRSSFSGTIGELLAHQNDPQAQAALQSGQAWAGAAQQIGHTVGNLPGQILQAKQAQQNEQMRTMQMQELQRKVDDMKALDQAFQAPGGRDSILNALPGHLRPTVMKQFTDADEAAAKANKAISDAATASNDYFGSLAAGVKAHQYDPTAAQLALAHAKSTFQNNPVMLDQITRIEAAIHQNPTPEAVQQFVDPLIAQSTKQRELGATETTAAARAVQAQTGAQRMQMEAPKIAAETQKTQAELAGTLPMTPAQQASNDIAQKNLAVRQQQLALAQRKAAGEVNAANDPQLVQYWSDQLVRDPQNLKMLTSDKDLLKAVRRELATRGVDLNNLDSASRTMAIAAKDVSKVLPTIEQEAKQLDALGLMGAAGSRWRDFLSNKIGASELAGGSKQNGELLGKFRADVGLLKTALMKAHVGSRGGVQLLDEFNSILNAEKTDLPGVLGALQGVKGWMDLYANRIPDTQPQGTDADPLGILKPKK